MLRTAARTAQSFQGRQTGRLSWRRFRGVLTGVVLTRTCLGCLTAGRAEAASAPDSARIASLQFALRDFNDIQVVAGGTKLFGHSATVLPGGFHLDRIPEGKRVSLQTPPQERLVPWTEIESIHVRRGAGAGGVVIGALAGLAVGGAIASARVGTIDPFSNSNTYDEGATILLVGSVLVGVGIGALIDHPWPGPWQAIYP